MDRAYPYPHPYPEPWPDASQPHSWFRADMYEMLLTPGRQVSYTRSTGECVEATITGPSTYGDQYLAIQYLRGGSLIDHPAAPISNIQLHIRTPSLPPRSPSPSPTRSRTPASPSESRFPSASRSPLPQRTETVSVGRSRILSVQPPP